MKVESMEIGSMEIGSMRDESKKGRDSRPISTLFWVLDRYVLRVILYSAADPVIADDHANDGAARRCLFRPVKIRHCGH